MDPLIQMVDRIRLYVPDLESSLAFYNDQLDLELLWRMHNQEGRSHAPGGAGPAPLAGLGLPDDHTEIVLF